MAISTLSRVTPMTAVPPSPDLTRKQRRRSTLVIEAHDALRLWRKKKAVFVDLRDWESADAHGWIERSFHCPPGEFSGLVDPSSPLHARLFEPGKIFIFYGGPRSAPLAATRRARALGLKDARALRGGLRAWKQAGGRVAGHPNSPFPALRASIRFAFAYAVSRARLWIKGGAGRPGRA